MTQFNSMYARARLDEGLDVAWLQMIAETPRAVAGTMPSGVVHVLRNDCVLVRVATKAGRAVWGPGKNYQRLMGVL